MSIKNKYRTHNCGQLRLKDKEKQVTICGWIDRIRDKGKIIWIDLRDRYGITQVTLVLDQTDKKLIEKAKELDRESIIQVSGTVVQRISSNPEIESGEVEIAPSTLELISKAKLPPISLLPDTDSKEAIRMKYRYLDLRRKPILENLILRHKAMQIIRSYLDKEDFLEIETPILIKSTPEGARDFIVPSRLHPNSYYALPQSPQILKQLLMVGGLDRYYQMARCFRDEDLRADRQPEFTQIDCELSFVTQEEIITLFEGLIHKLFKQLCGVNLPKFPTMTYKQAMRKYGTDRPDLRWEMQIQEFTNQLQGRGFDYFDKAEYVAGIVVPKGVKLSRKKIELLRGKLKQAEAFSAALIHLRYDQQGAMPSSVDKFYTNEERNKLGEQAGVKQQDSIIILAGEREQTLHSLGLLRIFVAELLEIEPTSTFKPLWVTDFPLFDEKSQDLKSAHHPFTAPKEEHIDILEKAPRRVESQAYDLVINGIELGGGSIRINNPIIQKKIFDILGFSEKDTNEQFGFFLEALSYGTPPHGGIALGLDRICMILSEADSIREFIAFPKNKSGSDTMMGSPSILI